VANGHTGALFRLSVTLMVAALSWGCLEMKIVGWLRLGASESAFLRRGGAVLRLVGRFSGRIK
jgi:hypothetical protein